MAETVFVLKGSYLFKEGDPADCMYIVRSGELEVILSGDNKEKVISNITAGELVGEMSLFSKRMRSAGIRAVTDSELVKLPYKKLQDDLRQMPEWVQVTLKTLSEKIREANVKILHK